MTDTYTTPGPTSSHDEIPKEVLDNICTTEDEYSAPEVPEDNSAKNKNQSLIQNSTDAKPSSSSECICYNLDKITGCFGGFFSPEILIPIGCNILLLGWIAVMILNYTDVIDLPRKNLFSGSFFDGSWDFGGGSSSNDEGAGIVYLIIILIILVIVIGMVMPLIYPEFIFVLLFAGYILASLCYSSKSRIQQDESFYIFTWIGLGGFYQIFYVCYNCGFSKSKYLNYED